MGDSLPIWRGRWHLGELWTHLQLGDELIHKQLDEEWTRQTYAKFGRSGYISHLGGSGFISDAIRRYEHLCFVYKTFRISCLSGFREEFCKKFHANVCLSLIQGNSV